MEWIFSGIGTEVISAIIGLIIGGASGYKIGVKVTNNKKNTKQRQRAGDNSTQIQIGEKYDRQ